jgi:outer membrane immunogenic protein
MRKTVSIFLFSTTALALGLSAASAADLAARPVYSKAPPMVQAAYDWSGFYAGINGGWADDRDRRTNPAGALTGSYDGNGGTVGGQVGYRWQMSHFVFGLEAQGNWADLSGSTANLTVPGGAVRSKMDAFGLFTGQVGYAWDRTLLYAKGGAAVTDRSYQNITATGALFSGTGYDTQWGATVGAGLEYAFAPGWSIGVEYDHIFEGRHGATFTTPAGVSTVGFRTGGDTDMVLGRMNYKFGGPVVARY